MAARTAKSVTVAVTDYEDKATEYVCDIVPGVSIRIGGRKKTGSEATTDWDIVWWGHPAVRPAVENWLATLSQEQKNQFVEVIREWVNTCRTDGTPIAGIARDFVEETGGQREWVGSLSGIPISVPIYTDVDITYQVGERAEYASYNLHYMGKIVQITGKSVIIEEEHDRYGRGKPVRHRLTLWQFCLRNWDGLEGKIKTNREWRD